MEGKLCDELRTLVEDCLIERLEATIYPGLRRATLERVCSQEVRWWGSSSNGRGGRNRGNSVQFQSHESEWQQQDDRQEEHR